MGEVVGGGEGFATLNGQGAHDLFSVSRHYLPLPIDGWERRMLVTSRDGLRHGDEKRDETVMKR